MAESQSTPEPEDINEADIIKLLGDLKHRIFPRPFERLGVTGKKLIGVEIGVFKGHHARSLLKHLDIQRLYLVDPYSLYESYEEAQGQYGVEQSSLQEAKLESAQRLAEFSESIQWIFKQAEEAASEIPDQLDFVYIDGNHAEAFVRADIATFYPKLRPGGVLGGHDYYNGFCRGHDGVVKVVSEFAVASGLQLQVELPDWWMKKTSPQPLP